MDEEGSRCSFTGPTKPTKEFVVWMKGYLLEKFTKTNVQNIMFSVECLPIRLLVERFENVNDTN